MSGQSNFMDVDWTRIPAPHDDGAARHLEGQDLPAVTLRATSGELVDLSKLSGRTVVYAYPMTGRPDVALPEGWDEIPGARGCTPQSCAFRDHFSDMRAAGADRVFGLSVQSSAYQQEAAERLHLPFPILSDEDLVLATSLRLPMMRVGEAQLLKRLALVIDDATITKAFYPVFPPDRNAPDVLAWLQGHPR